MNSEDVRKVKELLSTPKKICIIPHKNPDGDAIGATLGIMHALKSGGHQISAIVPNDFPAFLKWMPGTDQLLNYEKASDDLRLRITGADIIFALDFNDLGRIGIMEQDVTASRATIIMIDHHQEPTDFAAIAFSDPGMSSTCEMVYNFIMAIGQGAVLSAELATCLYAGILTDTGSFKYDATSSTTHRVAAALIDAGADHGAIHRAIFDTFTADRLRLLGTALKNLTILEEYYTAYITLSQGELDAHNFKKGDTEGFVNYGLAIADVRFAVIFIENSDEEIIKISFRSQGDFSVNEFARDHFNGGGHRNAAGGKSELSLAETVAYFKDLLPKYKEDLKS